MNNSDERAGPFLLFQTSGLDCAFPLQAVRAIVPMASLIAPPGTPAGVRGFLDLRGQAIPILRLDLLFHLPEQRPGLHTPLILLLVAGELLGILAEAVLQIAYPGANSWLPRGSQETVRGGTAATFIVDGRLTHLLIPEAILLEHERGRLKELQAGAQENLTLWEATS